jgi:molybdopterin/thiamine biosynthesis adenylyltransferase
MQAAENLIRKQYLIAPHQIEKIKVLADKQKTSAAEVVRMAIDAFNPDVLHVPVEFELSESELFDLVSARLKEAIADTQETQKRLRKTLIALGEK